MTALSPRKLAAAAKSTAQTDKIKRLEADLRGAVRDRDAAIHQLEAARGAKRKRPAIKKPRARRKGDLIRAFLTDTHGSKVAADALAAVLADLKALQPDEIILGGDMVDCGGFLAQHHTLGYVAETHQSYEQDIAAAASLLDALRETCPTAKIEYIEGNHERRVETWCVTQTLRHQRDSDYLRRLFTPEHLLHLADREIPYYRQGEHYDGLAVPGVIKRGKLYFTHGISTAKHATAATQRAIAGNIVFGHTHRAQTDITRALSAGVIGAWNPGCLCELQPLWRHTQPTDWTHGYAVQLVAPTQTFLHLNIPVVNGQSFLTSLLGK